MLSGKFTQICWLGYTLLHAGSCPHVMEEVIETYISPLLKFTGEITENHTSNQAKNEFNLITIVELMSRNSLN